METVRQAEEMKNAWILMALVGFGCSRDQGAVEEYPVHVVSERFSWPPRLARGSVANQAYLDFESWLVSLEQDPAEVGLSFSKGLGVWALSQCTAPLWNKGCRRVMFKVEGGEWHSLKLSPGTDGVRVIAVPQHAALEDLRVFEDFGFSQTREHFVSEDGLGFGPIDGRSLRTGELRQIAEQSTQETPVQLYLEESYPLVDLDDLMSALEELGASWFTPIFLH